MNLSRVWVLLAVAGLGVSAAIAQGVDDRDSEEERREQKAPEFGFWPTPVMVERLIDRITEDGIGLYEFDELQLEETRRILKERVPRWLAENRAQAMTLMNQYFEALLDEEPPTPEVVAEWAEKVLPLVDSFEGLMISVTDDMRGVLNADQITILEGEVAAFRTGMGFAKNKIKIWAEGGFDPKIDWPRDNPEHRKYSREERRLAEREMNAAREQAIIEAGGSLPGEPATGAAPGVEPVAAAAPADAPRAGTEAAAETAPPDEWERYVEAFVRKYELDADQQSKARTFLKRAQEARDQYKQKKTREMRDLQKQFEELKTYTGADKADKLKAAEERYAKLYKPVNDQFERLKERLETLPRAAQRKKAREREAPAEEVRSTEPPADVSAGKP